MYTSWIHRSDLFRQRAISPIGETLIVNNYHRLDSHCTVSLLTDLDPQSLTPVHVYVNNEANTQYTFVDCIMYFIEQGYLKHGDFLVLNNWEGYTGNIFS